MAPRQSGVSGIAVLALFSGAVLAYSGVKGKGISASLRALIAGDNPSTLPTTQGISDGSASGNSGTRTSNFAGTTVPQLSGTTTQKQIASALKSNLNLSRAGVAAVLANIQYESGFSTTVLGDNGTSIGLAQWHSERWDNLKAFARSVGGKETDLAVQIGFLEQELRGYPDLLRELQTTNDAATTAGDFDRIFERSTGASRSGRMSAAQRFYMLLQSWGI